MKGALRGSDLEQVYSGHFSSKSPRAQNFWYEAPAGVEMNSQRWSDAASLLPCFTLCQPGTVAPYLVA